MSAEVRLEWIEKNSSCFRAAADEFRVEQVAAVEECATEFLRDPFPD